MATSTTDYEPSKIEPRWQSWWSKNKTFRAANRSEKPKYYVLDMFPYPSGAGLHVGHIEGYTATDILARYHWAKGCNVLHPMGWDAFGLPAEQNAIKTGSHPAKSTAANIANFRKQMDAVGFAIDWSREVNTTDPNYYRWTQWIFLNLFRKGLAYVDERPVWWCPELKAVLANEEVVDGKSEIGAHPVERKALRQWVLRITAYADKLIAGLADMDWPDSTKRMQKSWIGRSEGASVQFGLEGHPNDALEVFTTRPDTLFGVTYMVLAPEHHLVAKLTTSDQKAEVQTYVEATARKSDLDRTDLAKDKTGVFTGSFALNPLSGARIPIWIADYVLASYGTGAIMAVPAHDERDYEFAQQFQLPIQQVIEKPHDSGSNGKPTELPFTEKGILTHSNGFSGLASDEAAAKITEELEKREKGDSAISYRLRDWLFSRQRYWGEPFPIVWVDQKAYKQAAESKSNPVATTLPKKPVTIAEGKTTLYALPLPESQLPVTLPEAESYQPSGSGESPLANIEDWVNVWVNLKTGETIPGSEKEPEEGLWARGRRETNTMPQWAGSCWYHLRYLDPGNKNVLVDPDVEAYWKTPDMYIGGAEHAVLHLLYARFWHHFLHDIGAVSEPEPYRKLFHQGIILGGDGAKMSKSLGNVVNPDTVIADHGADALRLYEMFMGPLEDMKPWSDSGIEGVSRFLRKVWRELLDAKGKPSDKITVDADSPGMAKLHHETVRKVTEDIERLRFNTAISQLMIWLNTAAKEPHVHRETVSQFVQLLAPFAPHLAEELWERLGHKPSVAHAPWPTWDEAKLVTDTVRLPIQVNGKLRGEAQVAKDADEETVLALAQAQEKVAAHLEGKTIRKVIYVPGKILNLVVG